MGTCRLQITGGGKFTISKQNSRQINGRHKGGSVLFQEFFPRLQKRASSRYGQIISERQFKDWREDGLLPGPMAPKGRGRGLSPERHWPATSYRRALRICRYKDWGAKRQSQWWLGFWLSGEAVDTDKIRKGLKREYSVLRRERRSFVESDRWRNTRFETVADADRGGLPGKNSIAGLLQLSNMTPDQFRRLSILELDDFSEQEAEELIHELAPALLEIDSETAAEIKADISPGEIKGIWRTGHMADGCGRPGQYLDETTDIELVECLLILKAKTKASLWNYACAWLQDSRSQQTNLFLISVIWMTQAKYLDFKIDQIIHIAFELYADKRDGNHPCSR